MTTKKYIVDFEGWQIPAEIEPSETERKNERKAKYKAFKGFREKYSIEFMRFMYAARVSEARGYELDLF